MYELISKAGPQNIANDHKNMRKISIKTNLSFPDINFREIVFYNLLDGGIFS